MSPSRCLLVVALSMGACFDVGPGEQKVDPFRELEIVDADIVEDARAQNAGAGVWSFRHLAIEAAGGSEDVAARVVERALAGSPAFAPLVRRWSRDAKGHLDLAKAPFRLIAISNRVDLGDAPDAVSRAGEGRFVYAITSGPGDDASSAALPASIILEYALPPSRSDRGWAESWHALGTIDDRTTYRAALEHVTREFTEHGVFPGRLEGSALAQVRASTQDAEGHVILHELAFDEGGDLSGRGLRNTPHAGLDQDAAFVKWAITHELDIRSARHVLPPKWRASQATTASEPFALVGVDERVQRAFDEATCNGCHRETHGGIDGGFHVSPLRVGRARLSRFVHDPAQREEDDLTRRAQDLRWRLLRAAEKTRRPDLP